MKELSRSDQEDKKKNSNSAACTRSFVSRRRAHDEDKR